MKSLIKASSVDRVLSGRSVIEAITERNLPDSEDSHLRFSDSPPPLRSNPELWGPREVSSMIENMPGVVDTAYYATQLGPFYGNLSRERIAYSALWTINFMVGALVDPDSAFVLVDDPFVEMMIAAAQDAPHQVADHFISPQGMVVFANPLTGSDLLPSIVQSSESGMEVTGGKAVKDLRVRAIMWFANIEGKTEVALMRQVESYDAPPPRPPVEYHGHLTPAFILRLDILKDPDLPTNISEDMGRLVQILNSLGAIAQSSHTKDETVTVESKKQRKHRERKGKPAPRPVRVLSLHNPEYGRYELDAATGRKLRQHWVRGHWRNQWYPKLERNKRIWVDGFVRGDAKLGTVTGPKVYVARGKKPDDEEGQDE